MNKPRQSPIPLFPKPGFSSWLIIVSVALLICAGFLPSLLLALILAVLCRPLYESIFRALNSNKFSERHPGALRGVSSVLTQTLACLIFLVSILSPLFILSLNRNLIVSSAEGALAQARDWSGTEIRALGGKLHISEWTTFDQSAPSADPAPAQATDAEKAQGVLNKIIEAVPQPGPLVPSLFRMLGGGAMLLGQMTFFALVLHFLLIHGPGFWHGMLARSPSAWKGTLTALSARARTVVMATCVVHGLTALSAFLLALPIFWIIVGTKYFVLVALFAGICQFVPLVGSVTLVSLMTFYFFARGGALQGCECLLLGFPFIVGLPDLVIRPYLAGRFGKIHALTMLLGFVVGLEVFGPLGFVLGPLFLDLIIQFTKQVQGMPLEHGTN
jgi:predicted PurR-regulated permease PerM